MMQTGHESSLKEGGGYLLVQHLSQNNLSRLNTLSKNFTGG